MQVEECLQCVTFHLIFPEVPVPCRVLGTWTAKVGGGRDMTEAAHQVPDYMFYNYSPSALLWEMRG